HAGVVRALAVSSQGVLASGGDDGHVRLWDVQTGAHRLTLEGHKQPVLALAFSGKGQTLVSAGRDATVRVWDPATGRPRAVIKGHSEAITSLTIHPHGQNLVSGSLDTMLRRWAAGKAQPAMAAAAAPKAPVIIEEVAVNERPAEVEPV